MNLKKVDGDDKSHRVRIYTLSFCGWCKKTKQLLKDHDVEYEYLDMDLATIDEKREVTNFLKAHGLPISFPVIVIDEERFISGYKPDEIEKALE